MLRPRDLNELGWRVITWCFVGAALTLLFAYVYGCKPAAQPDEPDITQIGQYTQEITGCLNDSNTWAEYTQCTDAVGRKYHFLYDAGGGR